MQSLLLARLARTEASTLGYVQAAIWEGLPFFVIALAWLFALMLVLLVRTVLCMKGEVCSTLFPLACTKAQCSVHEQLSCSQKLHNQYPACDQWQCPP